MARKLSLKARAAAIAYSAACLAKKQARMRPTWGPSKSPYQEYLSSERWQRFRQQLIAKRGSQCERCGAIGKVDAHHKTYERIFKEDEQDVELLCRRCHKGHHGREEG